MLKGQRITRGLTCTFSFLLSVSFLASTVLETNRTMVDETFGTTSEKIVTEENDDSLYTAYVPDDDFLTDGVLDIEKDQQVHEDLGIQLQEEGSVLLKNNGTLPLSSGMNVTLLGYRAYPAANSGDFGGSSSSSSATVYDALVASGFNVNPTAKSIYDSLGVSSMSPGWASNKTYDFVYDPNEPGSSDLQAADASFDSSVQEYNDAAIIVLGRSNGEGADYKPGEEGVAEGVGSRNALALSTKEKELVQYACDNFERVIVLISTVSAMELGDLKDNDEVDAIMYIGTTGTYGAYGVGELLNGNANPSGALYDTYAYNSMSSPAMRNMGHYELTNADEIDRADTSSVGTRGTDPGFTNYVIEAEGIYVGYRYYETRYYDCVQGDVSAQTSTDDTGIYEDSVSGWNYSEEVCYAFGYGLSYTTFEQTIESVTWEESAHEQIAHVTVKVTNTGDVAGKTSVQVYGQAPYTDYDRENGIEKSAIQLLNFEKTDELQPDESVTVTVDVDLEYLASYDENVAQTYIMENSDDYYFAVGNGSHDALNNILAAQGKTVSDGMDYDGNAAGAYRWTYDTATDGAVDDYTFSVSKAGVEITNRLDYCDWNDYEEGAVTYLSRSDWAGTFPQTYDSMTATDLMIEHYSGNVIEYGTAENPDSEEALAAIAFDQDSDLKFADMIGADYDDVRWDELIDSMSLDETILFAVESGRGFAGIDSVNFPAGRYAENGPGTPAWKSEENATNATWAIEEPTEAYNLGSFPTYAVIASTFNPELSYEYGRVLGNDSILGEKPMLWLPGANIHRTPYNGRSEQYYSEDPVLTGVMTMEASEGARAKGAIVTAKHFAFNDQEMHRSGVGTFMTEQTARELALRAFQIPFESTKYDTEDYDAGMLGVMTSFSKLGGIECTVNEGLLTGILHNEWGFTGYMVSDLKDDLDLMPQAFAAGMGGYDWRTEEDDITPYIDAENFKYDTAVLEGLKETVHAKLYVFANSNLMNKVNTTTTTVRNMTWWRVAYTASIAACGVLTGISALLFVIFTVKAAKNRKERV